jgi:hypothetical protein
LVKFGLFDGDQFVLLKFYLSFRRGIGRNELADGVEDELELLVVLAVFGFERLDFLGEKSVRAHQAAEVERRPEMAMLARRLRGK